MCNYTDQNVLLLIPLFSFCKSVTICLYCGGYIRFGITINNKYLLKVC